MPRGRPKKQVQTNSLSILDEAQAELAKELREKQIAAVVFLLEKRRKATDQIKDMDKLIKKINDGDMKTLDELVEQEVAF